jgi:hypothetical protein
MRPSLAWSIANVHVRRTAAVAPGLGVKGLTIGGVNLAGIALGTVLALVLNIVMSIHAEQTP